MSPNQSSNEKLPLSAVLITLNAEKHLEQALRSVQFCEEILIVDSGSTDNTVNIATQHGARVIEQTWLGFGPQKQLAVNQARYDWVLCIDSDEQVSPALETSIRNVLNPKHKQPQQLAGYSLPRCNHFLGRYLRHGEGYPDYSSRLFHRHRAQWSLDLVHEKVEHPTGTYFHKLTGDLLHHSADTLQHYIDKQNRYTSIQAEQLAQRGAWPSTAKLILSPTLRWIKFYLIRQGFRDGWQGFVHIAIGCFNSFMKYAKTREIMQRKQP
jgi:glycosyltransferase involved in cell wall biosynthesis